MCIFDTNKKEELICTDSCCMCCVESSCCMCYIEHNLASKVPNACLGIVGSFARFIKVDVL